MAKKRATKTKEPATEVVSTPSVLPTFTNSRLGARKMKAYLFKQGKKVSVKEARKMLLNS